MQVSHTLDFGSYGIQSYDVGRVTVFYPLAPAADGTAPTLKREDLLRSLIILPDRLVTDWPPQRFGELERDHFDLIAEYAPEVVLFGSGARLEWPEPALLSGLTSRGIGVEVMDTGSACRTYNFLMADRRRVAAALLMIQPA